MTPTPTLPLTLTALTLTLLAAPACLAQSVDERPFKLTLTEYRYSDQNNGHTNGHDLNLRWRHDATNAWVGVYHDPIFGSQARTGFDTSIPLFGSATVQPSLQAATGGFVGGSVNFQVGDPWFVLVGWGRTNLKPYANLNFDPNDAITASVGWHGEDGRTVSVALIADDRLHTGQKDWHLYGRWPLSADLRLTLDLMRKTGQGDGGPVHAGGWSATLDYPAWFIRLARDGKQNFSTQDATRVAVGARF